jgi:hypothetical protein
LPTLSRQSENRKKDAQFLAVNVGPEDTIVTAAWQLVRCALPVRGTLTANASRHWASNEHLSGAARYRTEDSHRGRIDDQYCPAVVARANVTI